MSFEEGLPQVGELVAFNKLPHGGYEENIKNGWIDGDELECVALRGVPIFWNKRTREATGLNSAHFRPIKSEAELKREKAVREMFHGIPLEDLASFEWNAHAERICKHLHDAGYRKVNELTDEQINNHIDANSPLWSTGEKLMFQVGARWARSQIMGEES